MPPRPTCWRDAAWTPRRSPTTSAWSGRATPSTATTPRTSRCSSPRRSACRRARSRAGSPRAGHEARHRQRRGRRPRLPQHPPRGRRAGRRSWPTSSRAARPTVTATTTRAATSTSSSSPPTRPARCTSAASAGPRSATRSPACSSAQGAEVVREYYFNDHGAQIDRFARSLLARGPRRAGARGRLRRRSTSTRSPPGWSRPQPDALGLPDDEAQEVFRRDRRRADVRRDQGSRCTTSASTSTSTSTRTTLHESGAVDARGRRGCEARATSTRPTARSGCAPPTYGDDKDRVVIKSDGEPAYIAGDLAYYLDKRERGFDRCIIMLGADHHGYVGRLMAMCAALRRRPGGQPRDPHRPDGQPASRTASRCG